MTGEAVVSLQAAAASVAVLTQGSLIASDLDDDATMEIETGWKVYAPPAFSALSSLEEALETEAKMWLLVDTRPSIEKLGVWLSTPI